MKGLWTRLTTPKKPELSEDVRQVYTQLYGLQGARHLAWVRLGDDPVRYQSVIVEVDPYNERLVLDEPFGLPKNFYWGQGMPLEVVIKDYAKKLEFKTRFIDIEPSEDGNAMLVAWPDHIDADQRRQEFRVAFDGFDRVPMAKLVDTGGSSLPIIDLSLSGMGLAVPEELGHQLYVDQFIETEINLTPGIFIHSRVKVVRMETFEGSGATCIGTQLETYSPKDQRILERYLANAQRKQMRSMAV